ncbi:fumarylacetoacetate hydrolase family protein [Natrarchaeobius chitinivorans]|uniref:FAA hydrolase family protein n=1 Tax=Natrarchaeobius chitinivorans TaxID=1679083 RepID=A0A3N6M4F4_NATCH|nr:fumarylacetoacetate hydrolase family protein [Natrarchaeobius chitinivorans]RQG95364.1 FAA hydrolase family protein [Natrarchaeobius chitinivorans]
MRQVRFIDPAGTTRTGEWIDGTIEFGDQEYDPADVRILPPSDPSKIVCIGLNYEDHAEESGMDLPERPWLFLKGPNTLAGHGDTVSPPSGKDQIDFEAELGVVIDRQCRHVDADDAMDLVRGFTCANDVSNRDDQYEEQNWVRGKAFDGAAPVGPVVATPDHVPDDASIELRVNGETKQSSSRSELIFSIPELIEEITTYLTLEPGDIVITGTPAGVGPLADGDHVEVEIEGIGTLEHGVDLS